MQRQPIVTVLGHVDHGKTSLLDAIRKTTVASGEAGGITQSIGSSVVTTPSGKKITFIDTPGHAAFTKMRSRGAKVADIAILVIAADDGIKPQTKEAIKIIKESGTPFIVAVTKIDIAGVNPEMARGQLEGEEILFEGRGGETPFIPLSSKTGVGVNDLLEMIALLSEVHGFTGDISAPLEAVVIESFKDRRGVVANVVVRNGNLKVGEEVFSEGIQGKIRAIHNDKGESVKEVGPGEPAQIIGFSEVPQVGA
ncbi:MAG: translation initiation factor IF-2, partial [Microgenomates group bacterium]